MKHLGIDLGTTHTAVALASDDGVEVIPVPQLTRPGQLEALPLLPSFIYLGDAGEGLGVPWDEGRSFAVGAYARSRGAELASRVVSSAKSWLSHTGIDRRTGVLPVGATDVEKISPVEASFRVLEHLGEALAHAGRETPTSEKVVLTVPASFDAVARELTVEAAYAAGLDDVTLLEEPQAAVYAWLAARGDAWRKELGQGDVVLVVDVGGGTTDFSAIRVVDRDGALGLDRIAVGDHILLGGDNMDLALAHLAKKKLEGRELDAHQLAGLVHAARGAKELLLSRKTDEASVVVAGRGSKLVGGSIKTSLARAEVDALVLDGFFPLVAADARPITRARAALTSVGLPYAQDPAVTRHLSAFVAGLGDAFPTRVLLNGGVMQSTAIADRLLAALASWAAALGKPAPTLLGGAELDLAVAKGAAAYGVVRETGGLRIKGGTARAYYVGIESAAPAIPGLEPEVVALCVAPIGMEEGAAAKLPDDELGLVVGEPVRFRFFTSTTRKADVVGQTVDVERAGLDELAPIEVTVPAEGRRIGEIVPVRVSAEVTEVGQLVLAAVPTLPKADGERFEVELSVRGD